MSSGLIWLFLSSSEVSKPFLDKLASLWSYLFPLAIALSKSEGGICSLCLLLERFSTLPLGYSWDWAFRSSYGDFRGFEERCYYKSLMTTPAGLPEIDDIGVWLPPFPGLSKVDLSLWADRKLPVSWKFAWDCTLLPSGLCSRWIGSSFSFLIVRFISAYSR